MAQSKVQSSSPSKSTGIASATFIEGTKTAPFSKGTGLVGPTSTVGEQGKKKLNPNAEAWDPKANWGSEDDRCLFITFSNGHPLSKRQIKKFFNREYGKCVEEVYVHWTADPDNEPPLFGKVIFKWSFLPAVVMAGVTDQVMKFVVDKKPLWCKRFHSKTNGRDCSKSKKAV